MTETFAPRPPAAPARKIERDPNNVLGGVASGLAHHLGVDVALTRLAFVFAFLTFGVGPLFYLLAWIVIPMAPHPLGRTDYLGGIPS